MRPVYRTKKDGVNACVLLVDKAGSGNKTINLIKH